MFLCTFTAYLRGIETLNALGAAQAVYRFTAYLRGIETVMKELAADGLIEFTAYLRGIETPPLPGELKSTAGSQPT